MKVDNLDAHVVQPGDRLIVTSPELLSDESSWRIKQQIESELPGVTAVVVSGVEVSLAYRPRHGTKETR